MPPGGFDTAQPIPCTGLLRAYDSLDDLRQRSCARDGEWAHGVAARRGLGEEHRADVRRIEDAAYGLRWLELAHRLRLDLSRSLVLQLPLTLLGEERDEMPADA